MTNKLLIYRSDNRTPGVVRKLCKKLNCGTVVSNRLPISLHRGNYILNYGRSVRPSWADISNTMGIKILNPWGAVSKSVNKLETFKALGDMNIPTLNWTVDKIVASDWRRTVVRSLLKGTKGKGILIINKSDATGLPEAPLYTEYYRKTHEFRVHVFNGKVIDYTQKRRLSKEKMEERGLVGNKYVRNLASGWVFCRENILVEEYIETLALNATKAIGLDFCGVDILANFKDGVFRDAVVCETNAAPGMVKTTFDAYTKAIKELVQ